VTPTAVTEVSSNRTRTGAGPNELQLTLPSAIVDRLEQLERRLEKIESSSDKTPSSAAAQDHQISTAPDP
jgi:hypothetical protein